MNVHDYAHQLARALKNSDEYLNFMEYRDRIIKTPNLKEMLKDFQEKQFKIQTLQFSGKQVEETQIEQIQNLHEILMKDPVAREFFQAEMRLGQLMEDINKIISETIDIKSFLED